LKEKLSTMNEAARPELKIYKHVEKTTNQNKVNQVLSKTNNSTLKKSTLFRQVQPFNLKSAIANLQSMGNSRMAATNNYSYDVLDRKTTKVNGLDFYGGAYKGLMEAYVKKLEETKASNSK
jgi:hypothetical protein